MKTYIELPRFAPGPITRMSGEEIVNLTAPILSKRLAETKYDRVVLIVQYLDHLRRMRASSPSISPLEAFASFKINSSLEKNNGNSCVGSLLI